jgi:hypothetical protein
MIIDTIRSLLKIVEDRERRLIDEVLVLLNTIDADANRHGGLQSADTLRVAGEVRALLTSMMPHGRDA